MPDPYDALAPHYRRIAGERSAYLDAVDAIVRSRAPSGCASLLDVGAGDGVRGMALARSLGVQRVILCDASIEMAARCRALAPTDVWACPAQEMPECDPFDLVVCLWNVLGHVEPAENRLRALERMRALLAPRGRLFLDVNNRHNALAYGWPRVLGRRLIDAVMPDPRRGDTRFQWNVDGTSIPARGHLFTPKEVESLAAAAGLRLERRVAVDYRSGATSPRCYRGQLVYEFSAGA